KPAPSGGTARSLPVPVLRSGAGEEPYAGALDVIFAQLSGPVDVALLDSGEGFEMLGPFEFPGRADSPPPAGRDELQLVPHLVEDALEFLVLAPLIEQLVEVAVRPAERVEVAPFAVPLGLGQQASPFRDELLVDVRAGTPYGGRFEQGAD